MVQARTRVYIPPWALLRMLRWTWVLFELIYSVGVSSGLGPQPIICPRFPAISDGRGTVRFSPCASETLASPRHVVKMKPPFDGRFPPSHLRCAVPLRRWLVVSSHSEIGLNLSSRRLVLSRSPFALSPSLSLVPSLCRLPLNFLALFVERYGFLLSEDWEEGKSDSTRKAV